MLVYRSDDRGVDARAAWRALRRLVEGLPQTISLDEATSVLIEVGELEAASLDAIFHEADGIDRVAALLTDASAAAGQVFVAAWRDRGQLPDALDRLRDAVRRVPDEQLPAVVSRRVSEGYAFYALHPETYALAASRFCETTAPGDVVCLGVRSIGTSLAAVAAAAVAASGRSVQVYSVRPRGHPFDRVVHLDERLAATLAARSARTSFLIVDEGPGLSGSSFAAAARALRALGIPASRIAFMPSWDADGSTFRSTAARAIWLEHRKWHATPIEAGAGIDAVVGNSASVEWSAGKWRSDLMTAVAWPAVQPQHERVKRWLPERGEVIRFAGIGRYGIERLARARTLAAGGFGVEPIALEGGYLRMPFVSGHAYSPATVDAPLVEWLPRYLTFVAHAFPTAQATPVDTLRAMIDTNLREADLDLQLPFFSGIDEMVGSNATAIDGRMLAHELIRTTSGPFKCDALDHASDHFFPGSQHIAWDVAAAEAELDLDRATMESVLDGIGSKSRQRDLRIALPFFRLAYAAFQIGYSTMAIESLPEGAERQRFARRRVTFVDRARAVLAR